MNSAVTTSHILQMRPRRLTSAEGSLEELEGISRRQLHGTQATASTGPSGRTCRLLFGPTTSFSNGVWTTLATRKSKDHTASQETRGPFAGAMATAVDRQWKRLELQRRRPTGPAPRRAWQQVASPNRDSRFRAHLQPTQPGPAKRPAIPAPPSGPTHRRRRHPRSPA